GLKGMLAGINAAGALLQYVREDLNLSIDHITSIRRERLGSYMSLDLATQRHLELIEPLHSGQKGHTLIHLLDRTHTPMGGRLLRFWVTHPLICPMHIALRQNAIEAYLHSGITSQLCAHLKEIRDLERLIMRIETGFANPRDLVSLRFSLEHIPSIAALLSSLDSELILEDLHKLADTSEITSKIKEAIVDAPPMRLSDGGIIKQGYHRELDDLRSMQKDHHGWIAQYQTRLREETRAKTLKIGFTKAFGYYIEVSRGQSDKIPDHFQRRQTLVNGERFITEELKEYEHKLLHSESRIAVLENELFNKIRLEIVLYAHKIREIAQAVARIDSLIALSEVAREYQYSRPVVDESVIFHIEEGRHPVIEAALSEEAFIPNDIFLDNRNNRMMLITGPNMAGKSTFLRQAALIAIMAQIGSFIPAKKGHIGIIDKVFSRIGASDDLSRGQSTFMVEMSETANILHGATPRSLVILDEIGRGTSTYDGISIAWAVAEYLLTNKEKSAKTLFATHYWELTQLEEEIPGAVNFNVAVHESDSGIVFLRKIVKGGTDKSYGIHVARLAGLPSSVIKKAQEMLSKLEKNGNRKPTKQEQLNLFSQPEMDLKAHQLASELQVIEPNQLSPMEALKKIIHWKERFSDGVIRF
ncbi:MAG TPA: DNA mismatch repair protein MutS, partial [Rhabdochlamydiaceae bacterium]|nr:DNA mismatch repair protein MutS [Rhabdochlamydiaceae bacterium]